MEVGGSNGPFAQTCSLLFRRLMGAPISKNSSSTTSITAFTITSTRTWSDSPVSAQLTCSKQADPETKLIVVGDARMGTWNSPKNTGQSTTTSAMRNRTCLVAAFPEALQSPYLAQSRPEERLDSPDSQGHRATVPDVSADHRRPQPGNQETDSQTVTELLI